MLKKMRWHFIAAAMAAFSSVILILLCIINFWNIQSTVHQLDDTLTLLSDMDGNTAPPSTPAPEPKEMPPADNKGHFSPEVQYMIRFFSVSFDADGEIQNINQDFIASVSEDDAKAYASLILQKGSAHGFYRGYRYLSVASDDGTTVIFLNAERELHAFRSLLLITAAIAVICLLCVFILVVLFSRRAITPYLRNIEAQKQFITNAGHELKTPLTSISTSADVLAMEYEDDEWVHNIQQQSGKMAKLIANLVTLSRLDEENPFPEKSEFSLSDAVWETAEPFIALASARGKTCILNIEDHLMMTGERAAIQQTVSILLDNAIKYSAAGVRITLTLRCSGRKKEILVSSSCAPGPLPDTQRLFDRFYRGDESHSTQDGTGIGLSIAQATVQAHGGSICAECSEQTRLLTFRILL